MIILNLCNKNLQLTQTLYIYITEKILTTSIKAAEFCTFK